MQAPSIALAPALSLPGNRPMQVILLYRYFSQKNELNKNQILASALPERIVHLHPSLQLYRIAKDSYKNIYNVTKVFADCRGKSFLLYCCLINILLIFLEVG